jgi:hypothetical protein
VSGHVQVTEARGGDPRRRGCGAVPDTEALQRGRDQVTVEAAGAEAEAEKRRAAGEVQETVAVELDPVEAQGRQVRGGER